ncbi:unnamed protein product, partial [Choristocarpus tenellus]
RLTILDQPPPPSIQPCNFCVSLKVETLRVLVAHGLLLNVPNHKGRTPLHAAAMEGHVEVLAELIKEDNTHEQVLNLNQADEEGLVPMHFAAMGGHVATVKFLRRASAAIDLMDSKGLTPAWHAVSNRQVRTCSKTWGRWGGD